MALGPEDLLAFFMRYLPSFFIAIFGFILLVGLIFLGQERLSRLKLPQLTAVLLLVPASVIWWPVYVASTARLSYTLTLLGSEGDLLAERAYNTRFKSEVTTVNQARRIALNSREEPNVRFYAALLIADLLAEKDPRLIKPTLESLDDEPTIDTQFFGGNELTKPFYVAGHEQPHLSVREIVELRLKDLKTSPASVESQKF